MVFKDLGLLFLDYTKIFKQQFYEFYMKQIGTIFDFLGLKIEKEKFIEQVNKELEKEKKFLFNLVHGEEQYTIMSRGPEFFGEIVFNDGSIFCYSPELENFFRNYEIKQSPASFSLL